MKADHLSKTGLSKSDLILRLIQQMEDESKVILSAVANAVDGATNPESKPEGKYDTRALEASYLAGAQKERLRELNGSIDFLRAQKIIPHSDTAPITPPALVSLRSERGDERVILLVTTGGGFTLDGQQPKITTVTPESPIGSAIAGRKTGDFILWGSSGLEWEITGIS